MSNECLPATLSLFELSRIGASAEHEGCRFDSDFAQPSGDGLRLTARSDGEDLAFWVPETEWRDWLQPQLAVPRRGPIDAELLPLLAAWTLSPLDGWLQATGLPGLVAAEVENGDAPPPGWRLTLSMGSRRLPLYLEQAPAGWLQAMLTALQPSPQGEHELALALGWCVLTEPDWADVAVGDALPIIGMGDSLDAFWLHPQACPGRILLRESGDAVADGAALPLGEPSAGEWRLAVEAGRARFSALDLAAWRPEAQLFPRAAAYPALHLTRHGKTLALGQLLRLDDGWAVRIASRAGAALGQNS